MESVFIFFVMLVLLAALAMVVIKYRHSINKWMRDPNYGSSWRPDRKLILKRRIEDAEAEMKWLEDRDKKEEEK